MNIISKGDFELLLIRAEEMVKAEPNSYLGYWWRGRALSFQGRYDEAVKAFYDSVKHSNTDKEESMIIACIANLFNIKKDYCMALEYSNIALELDPDNPTAILSKGVALIATGMKREASEHISLNWGKLVDGYQRAKGYALTGQKSKMMDALKDDLAKNPHHRIAVYHDPEFRPYLRDPSLRSILSNS